MLSKWEILGIGAGIWFFGREGSASAATSSKTPKTTGAKGDADLLKRANQSRAREWVPILVDDLGESQAVAEAIARWFGIESSGNPRAVSSAGERGLAQITKTSALTEKALTQAEWDHMADVTSSLQDDARVGIKVIDWCYLRASKYLKVPPIDPIEHIWYAKLYHQSPVEVRDAKLTGDAPADAARLETAWSSDAKKLHHLHAANVVAWGTIAPPTAGGNS
jgi:hypothetical protein